METTRVKISDLEVGDQILVGYAHNDWKGRIEARLFGLKTTGHERTYWGYATGTISKIERVRKDVQWNAGKYLMLTIDGVPDKHMFIKWAKASVVTY
jgi:hypothetical protein